MKNKMYLIYYTFFALCFKLINANPYPHTVIDLMMLPYTERKLRIERTVAEIYNGVLTEASKGSALMYRWTKPNLKWSESDPCCVFDEAFGNEIKRRLEVLFPDSKVNYLWPKANTFDVIWDRNVTRTESFYNVSYRS